MAWSIILHLPPISGEVLAGTSGGMSGRHVGTGGDQTGTNGARRLATLAVVAAILAKAAVDALSIVDQLPGVATWKPFVWEFTSASFFLLLLLPLWWLVRRLVQRRWPVVVAALVVLSVPVALFHLGWLLASRSLIYALIGETYRWPDLGPQLVFEWRKDLLWLMLLAVLGLALDRLLLPPVATSPAVPPPFRLAVKDGSRTLLLAPDEISHASSAGNYVELATVHGAVLHRVTLAALADELAPHGFVRIHRAHLVRGAGVRTVASEGSGDFSVTLANGTILPGSRRWRDALAVLRM
jgi:LytTr DNA-binding domain